MIDFSEIFTTEYLLNPNPQTDFLLGFPVLFYFLFLLFIKSLIKKFFYKNKHMKKTLKKKIKKFLFLGIIGLILVLTRFAEIEFFSMRVILYIFVLSTFILIIWDIKRSIKEYKIRIKSAQKYTKK